MENAHDGQKLLSLDWLVGKINILLCIFKGNCRCSMGTIDFSRVVEIWSAVSRFTILYLHFISSWSEFLIGWLGSGVSLFIIMLLSYDPDQGEKSKVSKSIDSPQCFTCAEITVENMNYTPHIKHTLLYHTVN